MTAFRYRQAVVPLPLPSSWHDDGGQHATPSSHVCEFAPPHVLSQEPQSLLQHPLPHASPCCAHVAGAAHTPPWHVRPLQQSVSAAHVAPDEPHAAAAPHVPLLQLSLQQSPFALHEEPSWAQGTPPSAYTPPQTLLLQSMLQQSLLIAHDVPSAAHVAPPSPPQIPPKQSASQHSLFMLHVAPSAAHVLPPSSALPPQLPP